MSTRTAATEIARNFVTLRDMGLSATDAIARIAADSNTDSDSILVALHYALAG